MAMFSIGTSSGRMHINADTYRRREIDLFGLKYVVHKFEFLKNQKVIVDIPCHMVDDIYEMHLFGADDLLYRRCKNLND